MSKPARRFTVIAALGLVLVGASPALAQPVQQPDSPAWRTLFKNGNELKDQRQWAQALDSYTRASQIQETVGVEYDIGEMNENLGRFASAWTAFGKSADLARKQKDKREKDAVDSVKRVEAKLARLSINAAPDRAASLAVTRNGTRFESAALNTAVPTDAGHYVIEVTSPNKKPWRTSVDITDGATQSVQIPELEDLPPSMTPPPPPSSHVQRDIGIGMEIGGGAVVVAGLIFGAIAQGKWSTVKDACPDAHCPTQAAKNANDSGYDSAHTFSALSTVGVIAGAAIAAGGVVLHLTAPKHDVAIAPTIGSSAYGLTFSISN